jgi:hypothetical protein
MKRGTPFTHASLSLMLRLCPWLPVPACQRTYVKCGSGPVLIQVPQQNKSHSLHDTDERDRWTVQSTETAVQVGV